MMTMHFFIVMIPVILGLVLAIPSNSYIVIVYLESIKKKEKLSPSDGIFLAKGIVNVLLQIIWSLQGLLYTNVFSGNVNFHSLLQMFAYFLTYFSFWLTAWLSIHYCASITNLSYGFITWLKSTLLNHLSQVLFLTVFGIFPVGVLTFWAFSVGRNIKPSENMTVNVSVNNDTYKVVYAYFVPATILGCIVPFCLSLLSLVLTSSFLLRHVWRVKSNDSGSTRPNLQAHITALRTIFFLLFMFTFFFASQVILTINESIYVIYIVSWMLRLLSLSSEAAVIFQGSNKLKTTRLWTKIWRNLMT